MDRSRVLALDLGLRRIGVAVSDALGIAAGRATILERRGGQRDLDAVAELVAEQAAGEVVVGWPLSLRGGEGLSAQRARSFAARLRQRVKVPVHLVDERLSSVEAERTLRALKTRRGGGATRRRAPVDAVAAQLILQRFLESRRTEADRMADD
ncbi:MAG TPA: Holliday junction resolvase RuvX [bacterium]